MRFLVRYLACCVLVTASLAGARDALAQLSTERLVMPAGQAEISVKETLRGRAIKTYVVEGLAGRKLAVGLQTSNPANYFNVSEPDAKEALFIGSVEGNYSETVVTKTGDYRITVYLMPSAARRNEIADYQLSVSLLPPGDAKGDVSDGLGYWEVFGVRSSLRLRGGPSLRHGAIGALGSGEVVRNLGCQETGNQRWCKIERLPGGQQGWAAGRYLREAAPPPAPDAPGLEGNGQRFDAIGHFTCAPERDAPARSCNFGVIHGNRPGDAGIWIAIGAESERYFMFEDGKPVYSNGAGEISFEHKGDLNLLRLGDERYEIPDAVIYGG